MTGRLPDNVRPPEVRWRAGIDLNPLSVTDDDAMAWLANLVWPEQDDRRERLRVAVEVARADPPAVLAGDLLTELPGVVDQAGAAGRVVVFHSAVIAYLEAADRARFQEMMTGAGRGGPVPLGQQRGHERAARSDCHRVRRCGTTWRRSCSASTAARSPGRTGTAGR